MRTTLIRSLSLSILLALVLSACAPAATTPVAPTAEPVSAAPTTAPATNALATVEPATTAPTEPAATAAPTAAAPRGDLSNVARTLRLPDLKGRAIKAVTENAYTPLNYVDAATGEAMGWEYDATNEICRRLNCKVEWDVLSWDAMIPAVKDGQFDVGMDGITINDERKQQVDFSDPYMVSQQFMLVRANEDRFTTATEFGANGDLLIGSQAGTTNFYTAVYSVLDGTSRTRASSCSRRSAQRCRRCWRATSTLC
jgi:ABC-type amino acid transport substrate-binding protein